MGIALAWRVDIDSHYAFAFSLGQETGSVGRSAPLG